jgi:hypothetical protein
MPRMRLRLSLDYSNPHPMNAVSRSWDGTIANKSYGARQPTIHRCRAREGSLAVGFMTPTHEPTRGNTRAVFRRFAMWAA